MEKSTFRVPTAENLMRQLAVKNQSDVQRTARPQMAGAASLLSARISAPPFFGPIVQKKSHCACGGGCPPCQSKPPIQTKLAVSRPGDIYEQEADRVAEHVMRAPESRLQRARPGGEVCSKPHHDELSKLHEHLQTKRAGPSDWNQTDVPPVVNDALRSPGAPLDLESREFFEPRFGHDFSDVRVHADTQAEAATHGLKARAFTVGRDVVFAAGEYQPQSMRGRTLLAHELAHVAQQRQSSSGRLQAQSDDGGVRHISIVGGVPAFLSCDLADVRADQTTSCCRQDTLDQLPGLYSQARESTDRAIRRMAAGANMDGAIERHFGAALWYRDDILQNLRTIRRELDLESSHRARCRIALGLGNVGDMELFSQLDRALFCDFNVIASATRGGKILTLCLDIDGNPAGGWRVILHEVAHFSRVALLPARTSATSAQVASGEFETYTRGQGYPNPMPFSLRNADSYASFVEEIGAADWAEDSNAAAYAPTVEAGAALTLEEHTRPGVAGRIVWTPFGSSLQMIAGIGGVWFPRREEAEVTHPPDPSGLRAYVGAEVGLRWIVGGDKVQFVLDVAGGGGPYVRVDEQVDPALAARVGLGIRFGGPQLGFGISTDFMRLFHISEGDLVGDKADDWIGGLMIRGHWGGSSSRPR